MNNLFQFCAAFVHRIPNNFSCQHEKPSAVVNIALVTQFFNQYPKSLVNYFSGGVGGRSNQNDVEGGFGGGGGPNGAGGGGGGGGGYSGGASGSRSNSCGGGGGSFNNGQEQSNQAGANAGSGYVIIKLLNVR